MKKWTFLAIAAATVAILVPLTVAQVAGAGVAGVGGVRGAGDARGAAGRKGAAPARRRHDSMAGRCPERERALGHSVGLLQDHRGNHRPRRRANLEQRQLVQCTELDDKRRRSCCQPGMQRQGTGRWLHPRAAARGGSVPVCPVHVVAGSPGGLSTVYATHTIVGQRGNIFISFSGTYNMTNSVVPVKVANGSTVDVQPLTTGPQCTWLITGGTGAYTGLQGSGTCFANAEGLVSLDQPHRERPGLVGELIPGAR